MIAFSRMRSLAVSRPMANSVGRWVRQISTVWGVTYSGRVSMTSFLIPSAFSLFKISSRACTGISAGSRKLPLV